MGDKRRHGIDLSEEKANKKAIVIYPVLDRRGVVSPEYRLDEAIGLAHAISLDVMHSEYVILNAPKPSTLLGQGVLDRLHTIIDGKEVNVLIVDGVLSPVQQRNLEMELDIKVIDRTGLILEIFGARARIFEGKLQVELAHLIYQRSCLVRAWTHLERQRGGMSFIGGPGGKPA